MNKLEEQKEFLKRCVDDFQLSLLGNECLKPLVKEAAGDVDKLIQLLNASTDSQVTLTQAYAVASEINLDGVHWFRQRDQIGAACRKAYSDMGSLKIGNEAMQILIPNGYGDGVTRYAVLKNGSFNTHMFRYFTHITGEFAIYDADCLFGIAESIRGAFNVYFGDGFVIFEEDE